MKPISLRPFLPRPAIRRRWCISRTYATPSPGAPAFQVFNSRTKYLQKERAGSNVAQSREADYLKEEVAKRLSERLLDINRHFPHVLDLGANSCQLAHALTLPPDPELDPKNEALPVSSRISKLTAAESSATLLNRDIDLPFNKKINLTRDVIASEESLPYEPNTFDAVLSSLSLHWVNDLPSLLAQVNNVLKPDAPFIAAMFGGDTLFELRTSLQLASLDRLGGISPHTSPLADVKDVGGLLQKAGFKLLTVDIDDIIVDYPDIFALMQDLQSMGESNAVLSRQMGPISRDVLLAASAIYKELHGDGQDSIPATFRLIYLIGWKEGEGQSSPLARGSGEVNITDILGGGTIK